MGAAGADEGMRARAAAAAIAQNPAKGLVQWSKADSLQIAHTAHGFHRRGTL
jgi:hypothetical protein